MEKYTSIFKEKNYYIGMAVGIAGVLVYQKFIIENYWDLYKLRDGDVNNTDSFNTFIANQRLIQQAQLIAEKELLEKLKAEEKLKEISDLNLFPPKKEDTGSLTNTSTPTMDKKEPNYLLYGVIGLGVLIGAFLIFKKK